MWWATQEVETVITIAALCGRYFFAKRNSVINEIKNSNHRFKRVGTVFPALLCFTVFITGIRRIYEVKHDGSNKKNPYPQGVKNILRIKADSSLQDMINAGEFPKGFRIGLRRVGWYEDEVLAWLKEREEEARGTAAQWCEV